MKGYNSMISDDRLHKTRFCKKRRANQNSPHKEGGWSKRGGGLEQFRILKGSLAMQRSSFELTKKNLKSVSTCNGLIIEFFFICLVTVDYQRKDTYYEHCWFI